MTRGTAPASLRAISSRSSTSDWKIERSALSRSRLSWPAGESSSRCCWRTRGRRRERREGRTQLVADVTRESRVAFEPFDQLADHLVERFGELLGPRGPRGSPRVASKDCPSAMAAAAWRTRSRGRTVRRATHSPPPMPNERGREGPQHEQQQEVAQGVFERAMGNTSKNCVWTAGMGTPTTKMIWPLILHDLSRWAARLSTFVMTLRSGTSTVEAPWLRESHWSWVWIEDARAGRAFDGVELRFESSGGRSRGCRARSRRSRSSRGGPCAGCRSRVRGGRLRR